jgi:glucokinase
MIGAVDIGGTKLAVGLVDGDGRVRAKRETATGADSRYSEALEKIAAMLREMAKGAGAEIRGIGIGSTGPVNPISGEFGEVDFLPHWRRQNLVRDLEKIFGAEVALENDADAGALAEAKWGAGQGKFRLIYVTVGTGIGGGIVLDGQLYRGANGAHPEFGHQVIDFSGPACSCGSRGCWEALAAGPAMAAWAQSQARTDSYATPKQVCALASKGDELARRAVEREARYLGLGVANLINLFAPDRIVFSGSVMRSASLFLEGMRKTIAQACRFVPWEQTELAMASLGEDANLIGAAGVWHYRFGSKGRAGVPTGGPRD